MEIIDLSLTCKKVDQQKELHGAGKWSRPIVTLSCLQMKNLWAAKVSKSIPSILPGCTLTVSPCEYYYSRINQINTLSRDFFYQKTSRIL